MRLPLVTIILLTLHVSNCYVAENCGLKNEDLAIVLKEFDMPTHIHLKESKWIPYTIKAISRNPLPDYLAVDVDFRKNVMGEWMKVPFCVNGFGSCHFVIRDGQFTSKSLKSFLKKLKLSEVYEHKGTIPINIDRLPEITRQFVTGEYMIEASFQGKDKKVLACVQMRVEIKP